MKYLKVKLILLAVCAVVGLCGNMMAQAQMDAWVEGLQYSDKLAFAAYTDMAGKMKADKKAHAPTGGDVFAKAGF